MNRTKAFDPLYNTDLHRARLRRRSTKVSIHIRQGSPRRTVQRSKHERGSLPRTPVSQPLYQRAAPLDPTSRIYPVCPSEARFGRDRLSGSPYEELPLIVEKGTQRRKTTEIFFYRRQEKNNISRNIINDTENKKNYSTDTDHL